MRYTETFHTEKIAAGLQRGLRRSIGAVKNGMELIEDKTGNIARQGLKQFGELGRKSRESLKKVFKKAA